MRKFLAFVLAFCFAFLSAIPARADSTDDGYGWFQLLDYGSLKRPAGDNTYIAGNITNLATSDLFYYTLPSGFSINYVDMIIEAANLTSISAGHTAWGFNTLTLSKVSGNLYRAYGAIPAHGYVDLQFKTVSSKATSIAVYSIRVLNSAFTASDIGTYRWEHTNGGATNSGSANTSGLPRTWTIPWYSETTEFILTIPNAAAKKYDYVDVSFACTWSSVNAISVTSGRLYIPYDYGFIQADGGEDNFSWLCTTIRIDLTDFISESTDVFVRVEGVMKTDCQFQLQGIKGIVNVRYFDPELYWYQQIYGALTNPPSNSVLAYMRNALEAMAGVIGNMYSYMTGTLTTLLNGISRTISDGFADLGETILNGFNDLGVLVVSFKTTVVNKFDELISILSPDTTESDATAEELAQRGEEIGGLNQQIGAMQRPNIDSINADLSYVTSSSDMALAGNVLSVFFSGEIGAQMMTTAFILMIAAYALFGKR